MAKKNDMDHMKALLGLGVSAKPARMPTTPSRGNIDNMPTRPTGLLSASDATALNKAFGTTLKAGAKVNYK